MTLDSYIRVDASKHLKPTPNTAEGAARKRLPYRSQQPRIAAGKQPNDDQDGLSTRNYMRKQALAVKADLSKSTTSLTKPGHLASIYNERTELDVIEKRRRKNMLMAQQ